MRRTLAATAAVLAATALAAPGRARAQDPAAADDPVVLEARREFTTGADLVRAERWGEALAAFERAAEKKPHAITTFNIAQCERAMGQYTRARRDFLGALEQDRASGGAQLPEISRVDARGLVAEIERLLAHVSVTLQPPEAAIAVDGRPLERDGDRDAFVAGTLPPGPG